MTLVGVATNPADNKEEIVATFYNKLVQY